MLISRVTVVLVQHVNVDGSGHAGIVDVMSFGNQYQNERTPRLATFLP
jgi:hypothetical protein